MGIFIQMDNINEFDRVKQKIIWNKLKESFSWRDIVGYSSYPLLNKNELLYKDDIILLLDRVYGIIILDVKEFYIKDINKIGSNCWIIKNNHKRVFNPKSQEKSCLYNIKSKLSTNRNLRSDIRSRYILLLPNITKKQWMDREYDKINNDINIIFKDEIENNTFVSILTSSSSINYNKGMNYKDFLLSKTILEEDLLMNFGKYLVLDTEMPQGPQKLHKTAC